MKSRATRLATGFFLACMITGTPGLMSAQDRTGPAGGGPPSASYLRSVVRFLSQDALEGRRAGTTGGELAALYISSQFEALGLAGDEAGGGYEHEISLEAVASDATLVLGGLGQTITIGPDDSGLLAWPTRPAPSVISDGPLVFVGFGIRAPEYGWDDFGDAPLTDRIVVALAGDPGLLDTTKFRGRRGTAYGTVEQKVREAAARGAKGVFIVHDRELTGVPWETIRAEWGTNVLLDAEAAGAGTEFVGWLSSERFSEMLGSFGRDVGVLRGRAQLETFGPIPLGLHAVVQVRSDVGSVRTSAVLGWVRGSDPAVASEVVVVTSHYDHLGVAGGFGLDSVFNGARDNAAGVAVLLGAAAAMRAAPQPPRRSVLFLASTAVEGAFPFARLPVRQAPVDAERIAAVINIERPVLSDGPAGLASIDAEDAGLLSALEAATQQEGVELTPWPNNELLPGRFGLVHVAFATLGVPGLTLVGEPPPDGQDPYYAEQFHQPDDEFDPGVGYGGLRAQALAVARLGRLVANADDVAVWGPDSPYRGAWERLERRR